MSQIFVILLIILILIFFNALYVLAEFSAVSARKARISLLAEEGNLAAKKVFGIIDNPAKLDAYVATSQVGITISSLVLGFYGQSALTPYLAPLLEKVGNIPEGAANSIGASIILIILTLFQVLFGELIPKNIGIQEPERFTILTAKPLDWSSFVFSPLIKLFNGSGIALMKLLNIHPSTEHTHIHSPEEISILFRESSEGGIISQEEYKLLSNTLHMRESMVKHIMIPRSDLLSANIADSIAEITDLVTTSPFSRIPIFQDTIDNIIGIVHLRDLFCWNTNHTAPSSPSIKSLIRPVLYVPETMQVKKVLSLLQKQQLQVAIVLDEYGGTSGMVTFEDLIEEIFGDVTDEFDLDTSQIEIVGNDLLVRGDVSIDEINIILNTNLPTTNVDTLGGLITEMLGRIPTTNETVEIEGLEIEITKMKNRAVYQVCIPVSQEAIPSIRFKLS